MTPNAITPAPRRQPQLTPNLPGAGFSGRNRRRRPGPLPAIALAIFLPLLATALAAPSIHAGELRIGTWNLEHLDDTDGDGCVGRTQADYDAIARHLAALDLDVVAFQEVENETAARRVFPPSTSQVALSSRPPMTGSRRCWDRPQAQLGHLATGFAIRRGLAWRRNADLSALGGGGPFQRWGTDITVTAQGRDLRLLSVHLKTGCWGAAEDADRRRDQTCSVLRRQFLHLGDWVNARLADGTAFVILGDFNRRLALPADWAWRALSPPSAPLHLATAAIRTQCDPRYTSLIDHLVTGGGAERMLVDGSVREAPRRGRHPDHCAISAVFKLGP